VSSNGIIVVRDIPNQQFLARIPSGTIIARGDATNETMLYNFIKVIFRHLLRRRFFAALNIAGLSIGTACSIVIYLFITTELSYDKFQGDGKKIYRLVRQSNMNGMPYNIGVTSAPYADALLQDYDGRIQSATRALAFNSVIRHDTKTYTEEKLLLADANFFEFFSYPLAVGDPNQVLSQPNNIVISKALAEKYFGNEDPIGKTLRMDNEYDLVVTGILGELEHNTHLQFDAVGSTEIVAGESWYNDWWANSFNTYVKVEKKSDVDFLNKTFPDFMDKYLGADFARVGNRTGLVLEPLHDIYFNYDTRYETNILHGDKRYVFIFGSIGVLLILLASINYINLATAQANERAMEVGIRKALGSSQTKVAVQFLSESFFLSLIALITGICMAQFTIPLFNEAFALSIPGLFSDPYLLVFLIILLLFITVVSGAYPSFLLASFKPVKILKGEVKGNLQYLLLRKALVVFQFSISAFMLIATLLVGSQISFMQKKDLGFQPEQLMIVKMNNSAIQRQRISFRQELLRDNHVIRGSYTSGYPGGFYDASTINLQGSDENMRMRTLWCDEDLLETMDLKLISGRFFSTEFPADSVSSVILNETAVKQFGWSPEEAIGKRLIRAQFDSTFKAVVGVVQDYHFTSLKQKIEPLIISHSNSRGHLLLKVSGSDIPATVASLQKSWDSFGTGFPLEFVFLDDVISRLYTSEVVQGKVFSFFSIISVLIACFGILGLASYISAQRKKEIGIRKVLGATAGQVSALLMKDLLYLVVIGNVIAIAVAYLAILEWSSGFAYRAPINPLLFILGACIVFVVALIIVGLNASKIATENPTNALRSE
jgi:putative ABC transport system permease protein